MKKEAYYFSHDSNARHDEKILAMRSVYKGEGYGWYWMIIEMMRDATSHRLRCNGKYWHHALAQQMQTQPKKALAFISDCIKEFKLFRSDGNYIWSESLMRRMEHKEMISQKARQAAYTRWGTAGRTGTPKKEPAPAKGDKNLKPSPALVHKQPAAPGHQAFLRRLLSNEGRPEREAIETQTHTAITPQLLTDFAAHLTTTAKRHRQYSDFNTHLRNWMNTRPQVKQPAAAQLKKKVV